MLHRTGVALTGRWHRPDSWHYESGEQEFESLQARHFSLKNKTLEVGGLGASGHNNLCPHSVRSVVKSLRPGQPGKLRMIHRCADKCAHGRGKCVDCVLTGHVRISGR